MSVTEPRAELPPALGEAPEYCVRVRLLSAQGRLGRVRYIGFTAFAWLVFVALVVAISMLGDAHGGGEIVGVLLMVLFLAVTGFTLLLTIQRCHDFNAPGWLALVGLIPLAALVLCVIPGTRGENRYGPATPPNSLGALLLASIALLGCATAILVAISLAAFHDDPAPEPATSGAPR